MSDDPLLPTVPASRPNRESEAPAASTPLIIGSILAGKYRVERIVGRGGMGVVLAATHLQLQQLVAIKLLRSTATSEAVARFLREARAAARLKGEHVARLYDAGELSDGAPYMAMELLDGHDLSQVLRETGPLAIEDAVMYVLHALEAIAEAHAAGIVHRDLKPSNLFLTRTPDGSLTVKVLDFGISKDLSAQPAELPDALLTQTDALLGSPAFMAPEQMMSARSVDTRADIWSLGVILYQLTTGRVPFLAAGYPELVLMVVKEAPPPPSQLQPDIPSALEEVILRCLEKETANRFSNVAELAHALAPFGPPGEAQASAERASRLLLASTPASSRDARKAAAARLEATSPHRSTPLPSRHLPKGTITILCAFLADAEQLQEQHGERYLEILELYHHLLGGAIARAGGFVVDFSSERAVAALTEPARAFEAAIEAQRAFFYEAWPEGATVRVRIGLHTGEPKLVGGRYAGLELHRAMRVGESAPGGQVVLTAATQQLLRPNDLDGLALRDLGSIRINDLQYPERLFQVSIDSLPGPQSTVRRLTGRWSKLPPRVMSFIGRKKEIADITSIFRRGDARLVTLTGPGGTGKTQLSLEVARALTLDFPDGVVHVPLEPVAEAGLVTASIAQALDVAAVPGKTLFDVLTNSIGLSRLLLVLDNFEHLVDAAPVVADLLASCPGLAVLVTSREALKVRGEREHGVSPLDLPPSALETSAEAIASCEAVQLFVERVRAVQPRFELTDESAPLVAAICARLEGIPLAIELAASRMKMLTLPALHKRLSDRLGFLKGADRDRGQRHQTIRAAIDWSFNLLDEPHKALLCRASVFAGGFFIESAEEVCGGHDLDLDVFEGLCSLVDKSLLTRREIDGEPRLGALETIREYALERLRASPDEAVMRERHAAHFAALVTKMAPGAMGRDFRRCAGRLFTEADNIRAALGWALEQPSQLLAGRMLYSLIWFWASYGRLEEAHTWTARALEQTRGRADGVPRGIALELAGWISMLMGDMPRALELSTEGIALWERLGREPDGARTRIMLGISTAVNGDLARGLALLNEACEACRARKDLFGVALALNILGELARAAGDYDELLARNEEAIVILHKIGNTTTPSLFTINLSYAYLHKGDWKRAALAMVEALELNLEINNSLFIGYYLAVMACVASVRGKHAEGLRLFGAADAVLRALGATILPWDQTEYDRYLDPSKAALGEEAVVAAIHEGSTWSRDLAIAATVPLRS